MMTREDSPFYRRSHSEPAARMSRPAADRTDYVGSRRTTVDGKLLHSPRPAATAPSARRSARGLRPQVACHSGPAVSPVRRATEVARLAYTRTQAPEAL